MRPGRAFAALALALPLLACGDVDAASRTQFAGSAVPIPAERVGDLRLTRIDREVRAGPATLVVTEIDGGVVTVSSRQLSDRPGVDSVLLSDQGHPGPRLTDGRQTIEYFDSELNIAPALAVEGRTADEVITAAGRDRTLAELAAVLDEVSLPLDGPSAVPGRVIGMLELPNPDGVQVTYESSGRGFLVAIDEVTLAEQDAYRALIHNDPEASIDPATESSCCPAGILERPREVSVGSRVGLIATLTPHQRVLLVEGDPGLLVRPAGGSEPQDDDLIAVAAAITAGSRGDRDELASMLIDRQREAQAALATAYEQSLGWEVLERVDQGEFAVIVSTGSTPRPARPTEALNLCATVGGYGLATCLPDVLIDEVVLAERQTDVILGSVPPTTRSVSIDFPEGSVDATVLHLEPGRGLPPVVFVTYTPIGEQIELTGSPLRTELMARIDVVARDEAGRVVARVPLFPHLRDR